jgi:hypothetical protein
MSAGAYCTFPALPPFNPLRLASNYRDGYGDSHALLTELTDAVIASGCYVPRIFHAPDTSVDNEILQTNRFLEYALALPIGSFILAYLHGYTAAPSANVTDPPAASGFRVQITDIKPNYKFFGKPVPEAFFLNDIPSANPNSVLSPNLLSVQNQSARLLTAPYPVTAPGIFKIEFWNILTTGNVSATLNPNVRLSFLVAIPDPDLKVGS